MKLEVVKSCVVDLRPWDMHGSLTTRLAAFGSSSGVVLLFILELKIMCVL